MSIYFFCPYVFGGPYIFGTSHHECCVIELCPFTCYAFVVLHLHMRTVSMLKD